jgi:hypothetical protein
MRGTVKYTDARSAATSQEMIQQRNIVDTEGESSQ